MKQLLFGVTADSVMSVKTTLRVSFKGAQVAQLGRLREGRTLPGSCVQFIA